jgi:NADH dehydrogenase
MRNLKSRGIDVRLGVGVKSVTGTQLVTTEDEVIDTRTVVATIGNAPLPVVARMGLPLTHGRVKVDRSFRVEGHETVWSLGDCAMIPMTDGASERGDFAPPTAQFAVREAAALAEAIGAVEAGRPPAPFDYASKGALASLGARRGVADVMGVRLTGVVAWLLWRAYYVGFLPGVATRIRVLASWLLDAITPRPVVVIRSSDPQPSRQVHFRAGDRIYETGTRADGLYTVIEGTVEVIGTDPKTGDERRRDIGPGGHFGERMLLGATRRVATARAKTDVVALVLSREEFLRIAEGLPPFREHFKSHLEKEGLDWDAP